MNLYIEIPEDKEQMNISLHDAFYHVADKRGIYTDDLFKIYYAIEHRNVFFNENDISNKNRRREFATYYRNSHLTTASCRFLYHSTDTEFTKIYIFHDDFKKNVVIAKIIAEIYFQQHANEFSSVDKCSFLVPKIYKYGFVDNHEYEGYNVFYFTMENTNSVTINNIHSLNMDSNNSTSLKYIDSKYKANDINKCLKCHGFYHNDLHSNNIMVNQNHQDIFIIDYGESSKIENNTAGFLDHQYCIDCDHEKKCYSI